LQQHCAQRIGRYAERLTLAQGQPVRSLRTLLADLATLTRNTVRCGKAPAMALLARLTEIQQSAFDLLASTPQL